MNILQTLFRDMKGIVPIHPGVENIKTKENARLVYNGGPLMPQVKVYTLFWGNAWLNPQYASFIDPVNKFFADILQSSLLEQLGEYATQYTSIGKGQLLGTQTITNSSPPRILPDFLIRRFIKKQLQNGTMPKVDSNTLIFVYPPPFVRVMQGFSFSCKSFCGYHDAIKKSLFYAVIPFPSCTGCNGGMKIFDALTVTSSHELCEAITDPIPGSGWYDQQNGEIGDICAWQLKNIDGFAVQKEWSNQQNQCI
jgi:hypothetical protein